MAIDTGSWEPLYHSWLFIIGPFFGASIAAFYYSWFHLAATNSTGWFSKEEVKKEELKSGNVDKFPVKKEGLKSGETAELKGETKV